MQELAMLLFLHVLSVRLRKVGSIPEVALRGTSDPIYPSHHYLFRFINYHRRPRGYCSKLVTFLF